MNYYKQQLDRINPLLTPHSPSIKVFANGNGTDTNHLNLNKESAHEIIYFLAKNFLSDKEIEKTIKNLKSIIQ